MLGLQRATGTAVVSIGAGPSSVGGQGLEGRSWGLGLEARFVWRGRRKVGPGLYAFASINSRSSLFGLTLGVHFSGS